MHFCLPSTSYTISVWPIKEQGLIPIERPEEVLDRGPPEVTRMLRTEGIVLGFWEVDNW